MAEWKKVIVSGSSPEFAAITVDGTVTANAFSGDGSALTGVAAGSIDIDNFSALGGASVAQGDKFLFSDNGTEKSVTFSNLEDSIFGNVSGDATIAAGGALTIAAGAVENAMLANNSISLGGVEIELGSADATPAFDLGDATGYRAAQLVGGLGASSFVGTTVISSSMSVTALNDVSDAGSGAIITDAERTKLGGIDDGAEVNVDTNITVTENTSTVTIASSTGTDDAIQAATTSAAGVMSSADKTKLDGIETSADVTDATNVTSGLVAATGISSGNKTTIQSNLGVDAAGTDNSTLSGLTATAIGKSIVTGSSASAIRSTIGVDAAGTDNSTDVTLAGSRNYITISGQTITRNQIDISDDTNLAAGTGVTLSGDTLSIGQDVSTGADVQFRNVTATGDLMVQGSLTSLQTTNLNIEDQFILLNSGSSDAASQGIVFGGTTGEQGVGEAFFYDADADRPAWSRNAVSWDATSAADTAYIPRVFDVDGSSHTQIAEVGSIAITGGEILIYA